LSNIFWQSGYWYPPLSPGLLHLFSVSWRSLSFIAWCSASWKTHILCTFFVVSDERWIQSLLLNFGWNISSLMVWNTDFQFLPDF
jgi:hypothetical protein